MQSPEVAHAILVYGCPPQALLFFLFVVEAQQDLLVHLHARTRVHESKGGLVGLSALTHALLLVDLGLQEVLQGVQAVRHHLDDALLLNVDFGLFELIFL